MLITGLPLTSPSVFSVSPGDITTYGIGTMTATNTRTARNVAATSIEAVLRLMRSMMSSPRGVAGHRAGGPSHRNPVRGFGSAGQLRRTPPRRRPWCRQWVGQRRAHPGQRLVGVVVTDIVAGAAHPADPQHREDRR